MAERSPIGVRAPAWVVGETHVSHEQIAALHGVPLSVVDQWLGTMEVYATARTAEELAIDAAQRCLRTGGVSGRDLSVILSSDCDAHRLQGALDAEEAYALEHRTGCAAFVEMLARARSMLRQDETVHRILIVCAFKFFGPATRSFGTMSKRVMRDVFSDGACAALVERGVGAATVLGTGYASSGLHADYYRRIEAGEPVNDVRVMSDSVRVFRAALARCLADAEIQVEQVASILFPLEGPHLPRSFARSMGFKVDLVFSADHLPMHVGGADPVIVLDHYLRSPGARPGQVVLLASRSVAAMGIAALAVPRDR